MTIRQATAEDVPAIVAMGERFIATEYPQAIRFNPQGIAALAQALIAGAGVVFLADDFSGTVGMMALTTYAQPMSQELVATEVVWWMEPEARGGRAAMKLLKAGEAWARAQGATRFQMIAPSEDVCRFYERVGFERIEVHYQRTL